MRMPWLRLHSEARCDPKLELLTDAQFRVWFRLLCFANDQPERGTISYRSRKLLAVQVAKGDEPLLTETLEILVELNIIDMASQEEQSVAFVHWAERQYDKASDTPAATRERKARQRDKSDPTPTNPPTHTTSRDVTPMSRDVTPRHGQEKKRGEEREETTYQVANISDEGDASASSGSFSVTEQVEQELNIRSRAVGVLVREYTPRLEALGKSIVDEATKWRQAKPTGELKNFENWLVVATRPDARASPDPAIQLPNLATGFKRPAREEEKKAAS